MTESEHRHSEADERREAGFSTDPGFSNDDRNIRENQARDREEEHQPLPDPAGERHAPDMEIDAE